MKRYILINEYNNVLSTDLLHIAKRVLSIEEEDWELIDCESCYQCAESYLEEQGYE